MFRICQVMFSQTTSIFLPLVFFFNMLFSSFKTVINCRNQWCDCQTFLYNIRIFIMKNTPINNVFKMTCVCSNLLSYLKMFVDFADPVLSMAPLNSVKSIL